jgi:hypothetical protein
MNRPEIRSGMERGYWTGFSLAAIAEFAIIGIIALVCWLVKR